MTWFDKELQPVPHIARYISSLTWLEPGNNDVVYVTNGFLNLKFVRLQDEDVATCIGFFITERDIRKEHCGYHEVLEVEFGSHFIGVPIRYDLFGDKTMTQAYYAIFCYYPHMEKPEFLGIASYDDPIILYMKEGTKVLDTATLAKMTGDKL